MASISQRLQHMVTPTVHLDDRDEQSFEVGVVNLGEDVPEMHNDVKRGKGRSRRQQRKAWGAPNKTPAGIRRRNWLAGTAKFDESKQTGDQSDDDASSPRRSRSPRMASSRRGRRRPQADSKYNDDDDEEEEDGDEVVGRVASARRAAKRADRDAAASAARVRQLQEEVGRLESSVSNFRVSRLSKRGSRGRFGRGEEKRGGDDEDDDDDDDEEEESKSGGDKNWADKIRSMYLNDKPGRGHGFRKSEVTVPRPFKGMEKHTLRASVATQEKIDDLAAEERAKLEEAMDFKFTARPVPKSTLEPRYKQMVQQAEAVRLDLFHSRKEQLRQSERPFRGMIEREKEAQARSSLRKSRELSRSQANVRSRKAPHFRAKAPPAAPLVSYEELREQEQEARRDRVQQRSEALLADSALPPRMQLHAQQVEDAGGEGAGGHGGDDDAGARQRAGRPPLKPFRAKDPPNFEALHKQWDHSLALARRTQSAATGTQRQAKPFSFSVRTSQRFKEAELRNSKRKAREQKKAEAAAASRRQRQRSRRPMTARPRRAPAMTKSTELRMLRNAQRLAERRGREEKRKMAALERAKRMEEARQRVVPVITAMERERTSRPGFMSLEAAEEKARKNARDFKNKGKAQAEEKRRDREAKLANEPLLCERTVLDAQKQKARLAALSMVAEKVYGGDDVNASDDPYDLFDEEERAAIAIGE